ncbi:hypothetical protein M2390_003060 [Mycetocola sp. BIGb0189]|uniref:hypothetical protein n=1 Tax=Mycetocola sp. BIGb0189 TaxID=2940604 RepID=UPI00216979B1|nr:hypothetical protein [Mycetocola sp. BIGb0189]MCS4277845.1 hypothetical protein [Mycetocola sp. BIGb0189]
MRARPRHPARTHPHITASTRGSGLRPGALIGEILRDVRTGTSRALLFTVLCATLLMGLCLAEISTVSRVLNDADSYRRSGASTLMFQAPGQIDAIRCEALVGLPNVNQAGAVRENPVGVNPAALPGHSIPQRDASEGFIRLITSTGSAPIAVPGAGVVISDQVAEALGRYGGDSIVAGVGSIPVRAVFPYPDDGRKPGLGYTVLSPVPVDRQPFDECWIEVWPQTEAVAAQLRSTLLGDGDAQTRPQLSQLNSRPGQTFPGADAFGGRLTTAAVPAGALAGLVIGFVMVRIRRLELASARHSGISPGAQALILLGEALVPAAVAVLIALTATLVLTGLSGIPDPSALRGLAVRICVVFVPAVVLGVIAGALTTRERQLFRYFKSRS